VTPVPIPQAFLIHDFVTVRSGPGVIYPAVAVLGAELVVSVIGSSADGNWLYIDLMMDQYGWIPADAAIVDLLPEELVVVEAPPTPTPPPAYLTAWYVSYNPGDLYSFHVQLFNFKSREYVEVVFARTSNGVVDVKRNLTFDTGIDNIIEIGFQWSSLQQSQTYRITATGDMGTTATLIYAIP
jgi:hypothetical protein